MSAVEVQSTLTVVEADHLSDCETIIEAGLASFVEVGEALADVRDSRLYRATHGTFEAYCSERWGLSRSRSYELIAAAATVSAIADSVPCDEVGPMGPTLPTNEAQARPLAALRDEPEKMAEAWGEAQETAEAEDRKVTAADVAQAVKKRTEPTPEPEPDDDCRALDVEAVRRAKAEQLEAAIKASAERHAPPTPAPPAPTETIAERDAREAKESRVDSNERFGKAIVALAGQIDWSDDDLAVTATDWDPADSLDAQLWPARFTAATFRHLGERLIALADHWEPLHG